MPVRPQSSRPQSSRPPATHRHTTRQIKRTRPGGRRRGRLSLGTGLFLFGLLCLIVAGILGGTASADHGQFALVLLILSACAGVGGSAVILWGLAGTD